LPFGVQSIPTVLIPRERKEVARLDGLITDDDLKAAFERAIRAWGINFQREEITESRGPLAELEFLVPNMVCEGCAEKISKALRSVPGVREVTPKVAQKHVCIRYEPSKVPESRLRAALEMAGFSAIEA